jgi:hypothetical protein
MREWEKALPELIEEALSMARKWRLGRKENRARVRVFGRGDLQRRLRERVNIEPDSYIFRRAAESVPEG